MKWCDNCNKSGHSDAECWGKGTVALPRDLPPIYTFQLSQFYPPGRRTKVALACAYMWEFQHTPKPFTVEWQ